MSDAISGLFTQRLLPKLTKVSITLTRTTGKPEDVECQGHSAKAQKHSAKCSPSVALGVVPSGEQRLGECGFTECQISSTRRLFPECHI